jgi:hypothetical protein
MSNYLIEPTPNEEAISFLARKRPLNAAAYKGLLPELRAYAFTVSGIGSASALQEVRDLVAGVPTGEDFRKTKKRVVEILAQHIPLEPDLFGDEEEAKKHRAALARRAEMVVRNNAFQAYSVSNYKELDEFRDIFTHWQYLTVGDGRVRASHAALNKVTLPQGHPFWRSHFPPWEFGCRCQVVGLTEEEAGEELQKSRKAKPEERWVLEGEELERLEKEGTIVRNIGGAPVRVNVTSGRERNEPGAWRWEPSDLAMTFADLKSRYDEQTFGMWEAWAKRVDAGQGQSVWDWTRRALGASPPVVAPAVVAPGVIQGVRTVSAVKQAMKEITRDYDTALADFEASKKELAAMAWDSPDYQAKVADMVQRKARLAEVKERGREVASVPVGERGQVRLENDAKTARVLPTLANYQEGAEIAQRYTAAKYLPKVSLGYTPDGRAFYSNGLLALTPTKEARVIAHEITHGTEIQNGLVKKSAAFLKSRRGKGEKPQALGKLMGQGRSLSEIVFEDEFAKRGGMHYSGRLYFPGVTKGAWRKRWKEKLKVDEDAAFEELFATEILTMGIERLHDDPVGFAKLDPEYFEFVIQTLQDL